MRAMSYECAKTVCNLIDATKKITNQFNDKAYNEIAYYVVKLVLGQKHHSERTREMAKNMLLAEYKRAESTEVLRRYILTYTEIYEPLPTEEEQQKADNNEREQAYRIFVNHNNDIEEKFYN